MKTLKKNEIIWDENSLDDLVVLIEPIIVEFYVISASQVVCVVLGLWCFC